MFAILGVLAGAVAVGVGSALLPLVNAEAILAGAALTSPRPLVAGIALALALGQTAGKLAIFEGARRGVLRRRQVDKPRGRWTARAVALLQCRWRGGGAVLLSAATGFPPLLLMSAVAGGATAGTRARRVDFVTCCMVGRSLRFLVLGLSLAAVIT
jgi:membrane protein YqaA with SNARE-associated domain